ncbi:hypothetical protein ACQKKK_10440 [Peribacillus sp. NPDC006672]
MSNVGLENAVVVKKVSEIFEQTTLVTKAEIVGEVSRGYTQQVNVGIL